MGLFPVLLHLPIKIETYWNVNVFISTSKPATFDIKIETYWNVN